ncbi:hypothetical protein V496_04025 [Pseudogymnoascus sp. VKM F-4515 (FW-2607)]|nr:hypothetical protein V496_04025 [Pseudogymnoascus sp. VKM F-4515 (FW-2607)]
MSIFPCFSTAFRSMTSPFDSVSRQKRHSSILSQGFNVASRFRSEYCSGKPEGSSVGCQYLQRSLGKDLYKCPCTAYVNTVLGDPQLSIYRTLSFNDPSAARAEASLDLIPSLCPTFPMSRRIRRPHQVNPEPCIASQAKPFSSNLSALDSALYIRTPTKILIPSTPPHSPHPIMWSSRGRPSLAAHPLDDGDVMGEVEEAPSPAASQRKADDPPPTYNDSKLEAGVLTVSGGDTFRDAADAVVAAIPKGTIDPVYEAKARVLNHAIQEIGMGWYQWQLFIVVGFGWANDNLWPIVTSLIFTPIKNEFHPSRPPLLSLAQNIGLLAGAMFWGFGCDIFGRKWAFNFTLGITAVFGLIAAGSPNFAAIGTFAALWSFGVGGNLPVDSAVFLEFLPGSHQYLLTILSIYWAIAQVVATLVAWPLLGNLTCEENTVCHRSDNMGWRYFVIVMGAISMIEFFIRFGFFTVFESPKYHMGKGNDEEAVRIVHEVARRNGKVSSLTLADLQACDPTGDGAQTDAAAALKRKLEKFNLTHVRALFATPKLAISTTLVIFIWAFIGLGYPLYNAFLPYLQAIRGAEFGDGSTYLTYRNSLIVAVLGVPGALLGGALVEVRGFGRKGTLAASTILTGVFLYASTTAVTSNALLGWNCAFNFFSNIMYAVLYGYTPEIFPTKDRGTGNALTATANRIFGIMAPIIAMFANLETSAPVYTSGALFIAAGLLVIVLPFESQGKSSL